MGDHTITISDSIYEKAQRFAQQQAQSVDEMIRARLEMAFDESWLGIPTDEQAELQAMAYLSDDALFNSMREQMQRNKQERLSALMDKNSLGTISDAEYAELSGLVEDGQRLTLRKATAMGILLDRGYQLTLNDMKPADE